MWRCALEGSAVYESATSTLDAAGIDSSLVLGALSGDQASMDALMQDVTAQSGKNGSAYLGGDGVSG